MFWNNGLTKGNDSRLILLLLVMLSAMLLPSFEIHPTLPNIRVDELLLFGVFGLNILAFIFKGFRFSPNAREELRLQNKALRRIVLIFGCLVLSYAISNFYGVVILGAGAYGLRDVMELVTFFKYFLVVTLVLSINLRDAEFAVLSYTFLGALSFLILFSFAQSLNLFNLNTWFSPFFNPNHWETMILGNPARVLGTFDNPNVFGTFTVMTLAFLVARYYFVESKIYFPLLLLILIGLVIKVEYLTISRTALAGIGIVLMILSIWAFFYYRRSKGILLRIGALFLVTMVLFATASDGFFVRLTDGFNFSTSNSFIGHVERLGAAVGSIWQSPVFGWGTQKYAMTTVVDNEYALFTRRYGFVGLAVYLWFFIQPWLLGLKRYRAEAAGRMKEYFDVKTWIGMGYMALLPAVFLYNFMAGVFYNLQLMTIFCIIIGLVYNTARDDY
ncbi:hypothetical protein Desdi_3228 [Desulfitobacterium dichloroeliminans LMG P-21439]|uniref:O-Antigen ligase n=1 Tax=Desulfitobacterium dichloroeliminans (strain LMG P-21439 / DCA1) TaxID=871963 RepID=L0FBN4_DESDL|nr:O-antigen ligase family protein [Desulfitobacterium dichloroeliminans]AGA70622.1 hypothetical protein Desdi_3228 [Desulfitobacterium dichloroeliminans LMG P-21439]